MSDPLPDWPRPHYQAGGASPFLFYVVFGCDGANLALSRSKYRCDGIPASLALDAYGPTVHPEVLDEFRGGYLWDELVAHDPALAGVVAAQTQAVIVKGTVPDGPTLNDFRNTIGLLTALLDCGGVAIFDPQSLKWWSRSEWISRIFTPAAPRPLEHVVILVSDEAGGTQWLHTRGLRKFGRPDLSIRSVSPQYRDAVLDVFNRFIEFQALGGVISEGQAIRIAALPAGMVCAHGGSDDDPDFNNVHVEIKWPSRSSGI